MRYGSQYMRKFKPIDLTWFMEVGPEGKMVSVGWSSKIKRSYTRTVEISSSLFHQNRMTYEMTYLFWLACWRLGGVSVYGDNTYDPILNGPSGARNSRQFDQLHYGFILNLYFLKNDKIYLYYKNNYLIYIFLLLIDCQITRWFYWIFNYNNAWMNFLFA